MEGAQEGGCKEGREAQARRAWEPDFAVVVLGAPERLGGGSALVL